jgi:hypothetical protein
VCTVYYSSRFLHFERTNPTDEEWSVYGEPVSLTTQIDEKDELMAYDKNDRLTTQVQETAAGTKIITIMSAWDAVSRKTVETKNGNPTTYALYASFCPHGV